MRFEFFKIIYFFIYLFRSYISVTSEFESHRVPHSHAPVPHMFSDESNQLETYTYARTK